MKNKSRLLTNVLCLYLIKEREREVLWLVFHIMNNKIISAGSILCILSWQLISNAQEKPPPHSSCPAAKVVPGSRGGGGGGWGVCLHGWGAPWWQEGEVRPPRGGLKAASEEERQAKARIYTGKVDLSHPASIRRRRNEMAAQTHQPHLHLAELTAAQFVDIWKHFDADGQWLFFFSLPSKVNHIQRNHLMTHFVFTFHALKHIWVKPEWIFKKKNVCTPAGVYCGTY